MEPYRLPQGIEERLQARARRTGRSVTEVAREAVLDEIRALEDYYRATSLARQQARATHVAATTGTRGASAHISS